MEFLKKTDLLAIIELTIAYHKKHPLPSLQWLLCFYLYGENTFPSMKSFDAK
jgi:hypothetical protein